ncbi:4Fe-4S dicluster domain-containing protein [Desulfospira joergensenii]|uniref:4Fe-4S dicluster domain-containing protein n=1 Tax=Desulfospira joergensenii TaxID=53329 RepID=UPI0003B5F9ED|nr:4Fe-4S dicluster domain-containing protein [Desulfospira joergensenii]
MRWDPEAEQAIQKVPFFVRKKVRKKVEAHAGQKGRSSVSLSDVEDLRKKFLSKGGMEKEVRGFEAAACFGGAGCPNCAAPCEDLAGEIEELLEKADIRSFLKAHVKTGLKFHHEFRVVLSDCPNACSRPQIADVGILGASVPGVSDEPCSQCRACVETCPEQAVFLDENSGRPEIDPETCLSCGKCIRVCPTGTLMEKKKGYRVLLGGRLGRHPRLGMEVPGIHTREEVLMILKKAIEFYKTHSTKGRRFSQILDSIDQIAG